MNLPLLLAVLFALLRATDIPQSKDSLEAFKPKLQATLNRHLERLLKTDGSVTSLKGKTSTGNEALAFYLLFEVTGEQRFRHAALSLADQILKDMRATKFGVLPIKEKNKADDRHTNLQGGCHCAGRCLCHGCPGVDDQRVRGVAGALLESRSSNNPRRRDHHLFRTRHAGVHLHYGSQRVGAS